MNTRSRIGRGRATTHGELSRIALQLFLQRGFENTTIDEIARAAGIGRRTFFRYFGSKNDLPWGDFDRLLEAMRRYLASIPNDIPLGHALRLAAVAFNRFPPEQVPVHRERMWLLLNVPSLMAHATLRYADWRRVIAEYVAVRVKDRVDGLQPQAIAWACLGLCLAAYEQWLADTDADLTALIENAFRLVDNTWGRDAA